MNIIIVGCGKVGQTLVKKLSNEDEHDITVIDLHQHKISDIVNDYDVMGVTGSGASLDTLLEAGITEADILIAVTGSDELNLLTCLIARKSGNCQTIARVRNPEYTKELDLFKEDLGLAMIINPEQAAAIEIARVLKFPTAIQIDTFAKSRVEILKFRIPQDSVLDNFKIVDINIKLGCDILVCGVERGEDAFIPGGDFVLRSGDKISLLASAENCIKFFKKINVKTNRIKDTIIVGGGSTAFYLARNLINAGVNVKLIEKNPERCEVLCERLPKATIICGDGTDTRTLLEEGVEYCESFVALTNIDEENIMLSLYLKSISDAKMVTKINRITYDNVIESLDLGTTVCPKNITAEYIVRFVRAKNNSIGCEIETIHFILDGKAEALEFVIKDNSPISNITLEDLSLKDNTLIACITRNGKAFIPRGKDVIKTGDNVIVITTKKGFKTINDILK